MLCVGWVKAVSRFFVGAQPPLQPTRLSAASCIKVRFGKWVRIERLSEKAAARLSSSVGRPNVVSIQEFHG